MINIYKIGLIVIRNNRLLLCKPFAFDDLIVPGGTKEGDEPAEANLLREVKEELGEQAVLDLKSLKYLGNFSDYAAGKTERWVEIELYLGDISGTLVPSSEIKELLWFDPENPNTENPSAVIKNKIIPYLYTAGLLNAKHD